MAKAGGPPDPRGELAMIDDFLKMRRELAAIAADLRSMAIGWSENPDAAPADDALSLADRIEAAIRPR